MANNEMIKQAYAQGAYTALKEAGYDDQTASNVAWELAKQAQGMQMPPPRPAPQGPALGGRRLGLAGTAGQPAAPAFSPPPNPGGPASQNPMLRGK
jgi:hypothetical protein